MLKKIEVFAGAFSTFFQQEPSRREVARGGVAAVLTVEHGDALDSCGSFFFGY